MSLVAYAASSDEASDTDNEDVQLDTTSSHENKLNGQISDDDDYDAPPPPAVDDTTGVATERKRIFSLPAPKASNDEPTIEKHQIVPAFDKLPTPKPTDEISQIAEEDDEFLHKKEKPSAEEKPPPPVAPRKGPVQITIPSLSQFKDLEIGKPSAKSAPNSSKKSGGLLSLLPKPKNQSLFEKGGSNPSTSQQSNRSVTSLIPDSVKNQANKRSVQSASTTNHRKRASVQPASDSDDSDTDSPDFFSFNSKQTLPEVSESEINAMVAKKAAQIISAAARANQAQHEMQEEPPAKEEKHYQGLKASGSEEVGFDDRAIKALVGGRAKRQKMQEVNIVELSANEVLPNKDEWLRTALASSTAYQPRGVLVDEEPTPGTRRKHQITYLAHQAKANELELQAMWSANRNTRRQTQGKYGF